MPPIIFYCVFSCCDPFRSKPSWSDSSYPTIIHIETFTLKYIQFFSVPIWFVGLQYISLKIGTIRFIVFCHDPKQIIYVVINSVPFYQIWFITSNHVPYCIVTLQSIMFQALPIGYIFLFFNRHPNPHLCTYKMDSRCCIYCQLPWYSVW